MARLVRVDHIEDDLALDEDSGVASCLKDMDTTGNGQTEAYLKDMGMTGLASACAMARRRPV